MRITRIIATVILIACSSLSSAQESGMEIRARDLVSRYFAALAQGDTETVLSLIGGELLLNRQRLLENPEYSDYLSTNYWNSTISVVHSRKIAANLVAVDASIQKSPEEPFTVQLLVESLDEAGETLLIVGEQDAAD